MSELLNIASKQRRTFKRHFLASVHCEIACRVASQENIAAQRKVLEEIMREHGFVESREVIQSNFHLEARVDSEAKLSQEARPIGLLFISRTPRREFQIESEKLIISDFSYDGFEQFSARFNSYIYSVNKVLDFNNAAMVSKVGLRKINTVRIEPVSSLPEALSAFNPALFSTARSGLLKMEALRASEEVVVMERGDQLCLLRTSLETKSENALTASLDFDCVSKSSVSIEQSFERTLPDLNHAIFNLFMWAVTAELINVMEKD